MLYWDSQTKAANLKRRLRKLSLVKAIAYAVGCATHAKDRIAANSPAYGTAFPALASLLDSFWDKYPSSLQAHVVRALADEAARLTPQEGEADLHAGEEQLIWATAYSFSLATRSKYTGDAVNETHASVDQAYQAVFSFNHEQDQSYSSEKEIREVERESPVCQAEMEFQLAFLAAVEAIQGQPPPYATILRQMGSGH